MEELKINESITGLLSPGTSFEGNLSFEGCVRIGGQFKGEIFTKDTLVISSTAQVNAEVEARKVIISGTFEGNISASESITMRPPAIFRGSLSSPTLDIAEGVVFEGASYMSNNQNSEKSTPANASY